MHTHTHRCFDHQGIEDEYHPKHDSVYCWRARRLLAEHRLGVFERMADGNLAAGIMELKSPSINGVNKELIELLGEEQEEPEVPVVPEEDDDSGKSESKADVEEDETKMEEENKAHDTKEEGGGGETGATSGNDGEMVLEGQSATNTSTEESSEKEAPPVKKLKTESREGDTGDQAFKDTKGGEKRDKSGAERVKGRTKGKK